MLTTKQAQKKLGQQANEPRGEEAKQEFVNPIIGLMCLLKSVQENGPQAELNKISIKDAYGRRIYL